MAIAEDGVQGGGGGGGGTRRSGMGDEPDSEDARRLTVEDRADLWEWFEEFMEDLSMDIAKVCHGGLGRGTVLPPRGLPRKIKACLRAVGSHGSQAPLASRTENTFCRAPCFQNTSERAEASRMLRLPFFLFVFLFVLLFVFLFVFVFSLGALLPGLVTQALPCSSSRPEDGLADAIVWAGRSIGVSLVCPETGSCFVRSNSA